MKIKLISIFLISFFISPLFGGDIDWIASLNKAKELAKKDNKIIMLMITQPNCRACDFMKYATFKNDDIIDEVNNFFIPLMLDKSDVSGYIRGTPTFRFYTPQGKRLKYKLIGGMNYKVFLPKLRNLQTKFFKKK